MDSKYWARVIRAEIHGLSPRNYNDLFGHLENMDVAVLRDLHRFIQDARQEVMNAKNSVRLYPGGPRIRTR